MMVITEFMERIIKAKDCGVNARLKEDCGGMSAWCPFLPFALQGSGHGKGLLTWLPFLRP
jgi:hypothetical protein